MVSVGDLELVPTKLLSLGLLNHFQLYKVIVLHESLDNEC